MEKRKKLALSTQIFIALVLAIGAGIALTGNPDFAKSYIKPFGTIFLNLIKWIVCPLVFFSIMAGVVSMRDIKKVGVIGGRTILYYMCTTAFAVAIGLLFANLLKGIFPVLSTAELSYEPAATSVNFMDTLVGIFPSNFVAGREYAADHCVLPVHRFCPDPDRTPVRYGVQGGGYLQ